MSDFKVIEVIDANTIKVVPQWKYVEPFTKEEIIDDKVKIFGLPANSTDYIKRRLESLLVNKNVSLSNPLVINSVAGSVRISCTVKIDDTDVLYYFPEVSSNQILDDES